jgi:hypothetical protein
VSNDRTEYNRIEPTQKAYGNPYEDTSPYYGKLPDMPPPPPKQRRWKLPIVLAALSLLIIAGIVLCILYYAPYLKHSTAIVASPISSPLLTSTVTPVPTIVQTIVSTSVPTSMPAYNGPTADGLLVKLVNDPLLVIDGSADGSGLIPTPHTTWLSCCSYYPSHGSYDFIDGNSNTLIRIGVFGTAGNAALVSEQTLTGWGWSQGEVTQQGQCLLIVQEYTIGLLYEYQSDMMNYCR